MQIEDEKDTKLTNKKIFELMDARFSRKYILYEHLHNSYNKLIDSIINYYYTNDNIFDENRIGELVYRYKFKYQNIYVRPPLNENGDSLMYPCDARDKSTTYTIKFVGRITQIQEIYDLNTKSIISVKEIGAPVEKETVLSIPCMVRSKYCSLQINHDYNRKECEYDPGGYFIVNGSEKYVLSLEKMVENKPLVFIKKDAGVESYKVKVNSRSPNPNIMMQGIEINLEKNYEINIKVPILNEVSVFVLLRALGLETDREIVKYIVYNENDIDMLNLLKISIDLSKKEGKKLILNKEDAYYSLTNKVRVVKKYAEKDRKLQYDEKKEHLEALLRNAFLPHINSDRYDDVLKIKAYFLGYMINKLLNCYLGRTEPDDRDSFINKRIDMPGDLIFELFKQYYKKMLNDCNKFFKKRNSGNHETPLNIINQIKPGNIEQGIKSAMMTGNWLKKKGVAQMYPRLTFLQSLSFLRRVDAPPGDSTTSKLTGPRHYHPSQVGFLCLTGDTQILMGDSTIKSIKDMVNGDIVKTFDTNTREIINTKIKNWFVQETTQLLKVEFDDGTIIKCTPDHEFLTYTNLGFEDKYEMMKIIDIGTKSVLKISSIKLIYPIKIKSIEEIPPELVYDFETDLNTHNFFANSLCVKNCCIESPEHSNIGLVKHMSLLSSICIGSNEQTEIIYNILTSNKNFIHINNHSSTQLTNNVKIFLNGEWIGLSEKPFELYTEIKKLKQNGIIIRTNSIIYDIPKGEIKIYTDSGRLYRPLLNVKNNEIVLTDKIINEVLGDKSLKGLNKWEVLIEKYPEAIDFVDMEEQYFMLVSEYKSNIEEMKKRESNVFEDSNKPIINRYDESMIINYTHSEFHPTTVIGIIAGNIPFANHNQGPRNIFQYAQGRQAMSIYSSNYRDRLDISYILYNVQKALVNTRIAKYIHADILPCGEQAIVAIACYTGHNQDDSIVFNQSSIDRGLFRSISLKKHIKKIEKNQSTSQDDIFMKPDQSKLTGARHAVYDKLNDKGYVPEETHIENGDVIIGKVTPIQPAPGSNKCFKDSSEIYKSSETAIIDKVFTGIFDAEGNEMIKIRTRSERIPKIGDKFCIFLDTDVLTSLGWIKLGDIKKEHKIATLVDGKKLEYVHPIDIYKFKYKGQMYKVRSQQVDLDVTIDHQMYIKKRDHKEFELIEARKIVGKRYKFKKNCETYDKPEIQTIDIDGNIVSYDAYLELLGMFIADGSLMGNIYISIAGEKERKIKHLQEVCNKLKLTFKLETKEEGSHLNTLNLGCNHRIKSKTLYELFKPLNVGAICKYLPDYVFNLNMRQSRVLLESLISCDGSHNKQGSECYYTSSKTLANDVMRLAIHAGWSGSIKTLREEGSKWEIAKPNGSLRDGVLNADTLSVRIIKTKNEPEMNHGHVHEQNGQSEEIYNYDGMVGCLEVPSHVFMIRYNNKNVWIGNCSRHGQKGTIGLTLSQSNMPFSEEGISPDLIINPQGIPSRMCVGHLLECLCGKAGAIKGMEVDGTSFNEIDIEKIKDILESYGYERNATEYLYNGMTGQKMHVPIYIGPTYYQRLKHLVMDKMHCLTGTHEVFTEKGWINIKDITTDIKVLTLNNNIEVFDYPTKIHKYEEDGYHLRTLFYVKNENIDTIMTEGHRIFVDDKLIPINELDRVNNTIYTWKTRTGTFTVNLTTDCEILQSGDGVYCLSVPSEIFYVKRNGKEFWTGNSRSRGPITMLTHQPPEGKILPMYMCKRHMQVLYN
jgi:DNA-directed RNA polymerase beta subunit